MFKWFKPSDAGEGPARMHRELREMLAHGRHTFDAAANAFLGGADPEVVRKDIWDTDAKINELERSIRREVLVHGSVHGSSQLPVCLVLMSIVKDAERIGDYSKNLFEVAVVSPKRRGDEYFDDLVAFRTRISTAIEEASSIYASQDEDAARAFLTESGTMAKEFDRHVARLLGDEPGTDQPAPTVLCYRYYKRIVSHLSNIITSLVMPVDQLDYLDEK
ncbi:MAG: PhoU domain-containing protein [Planctomycetota bacterium]